MCISYMQQRLYASLEKHVSFLWHALKAKGVADAGSAAFRVSGLELGGLFGSLLAGRISDALIARDPKGGNCGKRVQVSAPATPATNVTWKWLCAFERTVSKNALAADMPLITAAMKFTSEKRMCCRTQASLWRLSVAA